jgi:hypothetical protein
VARLKHSYREVIRVLTVIGMYLSGIPLFAMPQRITPANPGSTAMKAEERKEKILRLVRSWQRQLHLDRWIIIIDFDTEKEHVAACVAQDEYLTATLYFDLDEMDPALDEHFVVHELLHCHVNTLSTVAEKLAGKNEIKQEMVRRAEEHLTSTLERIFTTIDGKSLR